jgi:hypothetical protein
MGDADRQKDRNLSNELSALRYYLLGVPHREEFVGPYARLLGKFEPPGSSQFEYAMRLAGEADRPAGLTAEQGVSPPFFFILTGSSAGAFSVPSTAKLMIEQDGFRP